MHSLNLLLYFCVCLKLSIFNIELTKEFMQVLKILNELFGQLSKNLRERKSKKGIKHGALGGTWSGSPELGVLFQFLIKLSGHLVESHFSTIEYRS